MNKIFISGSINIKNINPSVVERINNMIVSSFTILVGDAKGSDSSIQGILKDKNFKNVVVYCSGSYPRNNIGQWGIKSVESDQKPNSRAFFTAKDLVMAKDCDYGLMIWDSKSTGTLSNVYELLKQGKTSIVFVNKFKQFHQVSSIADFEKLVSVMSDSARLKADKKINLDSKIRKIKNVQLNLFDPPQQTSNVI